MKKQVIAYLHTHWDREWYREFEIFRMRLLRVFDNVLDMLETNRIPCFYFDGQVSALEDYLQIRPEKERLVKALIRNKKLFIGPFYCLVDEFLTDRTAFIKNLELGMKKAIEYGCTDFIGYLADTFGHSQNVVDIMQEFGIDKCIVWRGCGDFPANFKWCGMDTVNLIRGYFQDIFSLNCSIEEKAEHLKKNLDIISEKSSSYILLPIGADHLGIPTDIEDQVLAIAEILKEEYSIKLSSPFDYFRQVRSEFDKFKFDGELRDNSKTFTLQGCYSSRLDLKKYNIECTHKLDLAKRFIDYAIRESYEYKNKYENLINYAYKMLIQNQAHDSICGCSTDDVHEENIIRYKKILQIANTIIDELKFELNINEKKVLNLSEKPYSGNIEFETTKLERGYSKISTKKGFEKSLLTDTQRIPITEDYKDIHTCLAEVKNLEPNKIDFLLPSSEESLLMVSENLVSNENIEFRIHNNEFFINNIQFNLVDFIDLGDSYNNGPKADDEGLLLKLLRSRIILNTKNRVSLRIDFESNYDIVSAVVSLDKNSNYLKFEFDWTNSQKNHLLEATFTLPTTIETVYSEDMNLMIKRHFNSEYNIRENLPKEKGIEAKTNSAPMQRGLLIDENENNLGVITKGLTQYEIYQNKLYIPILRATGVISNPQNPARTTPAGPPIETPALQMIGKCNAEFYVFFGNQNTFDDVLANIYHYIIS